MMAHIAEGLLQPLPDLSQLPPEVQREGHRQALEDMMWAMLTSKEFLFNY